MATWIAALQHGAAEADLFALMEAVVPIIDQLMGRHSLYEWTLVALIEAVLRKSSPSSYTSFIQAKVASGKIDLEQPESAHTKLFLERVKACQATGTKPQLPDAYFLKVGMGCAAC